MGISIHILFFIVTSNFKNSIYPRSFLCEEAKIKQHTFSKKKLCEIGEEAKWDFRFTCRFILRLVNKHHLNGFYWIQFILRDEKRNMNNHGKRLSIALKGVVYV